MVLSVALMRDHCLFPVIAACCIVALPGKPGEILAHLNDGCRICHELRHCFRVSRPQDTHISGKALNPREDISHLPWLLIRPWPLLHRRVEGILGVYVALPCPRTPIGGSSVPWVRWLTIPNIHPCICTSNNGRMLVNVAAVDVGDEPDINPAVLLCRRDFLWGCLIVGYSTRDATVVFCIRPRWVCCAASTTYWEVMEG